MIKKYRGFTIIELVIVIVILGILAAFAVPKFINIATQARKNAIDALEGNVTAAATLARSAQEVSSYGLGQSVTISGQAIGMSGGYPKATAGISYMMQDLTGFSISVTGNTIYFHLENAPNPSSCLVSYTEPESSYGFPSITATKLGCESSSGGLPV